MRAGSMAWTGREMGGFKFTLRVGRVASGATGASDSNVFVHEDLDVSLPHLISTSLFPFSAPLQPSTEEPCGAEGSPGRATK